MHEKILSSWRTNPAFHSDHSATLGVSVHTGRANIGRHAGSTQTEWRRGVSETDRTQEREGEREGG